MAPRILRTDYLVRVKFPLRAGNAHPVSLLKSQGADLMASPTAVESETQVLDRTKLAALRELLGEDKCAAAIQRFKGELFACVAAIESTAPERAVHAHNLAGVAGLFGFHDLEKESRRFLAALHQDSDEIRASADSLLRAAQRVEAELEAMSR
jgi:hypothetical protein